MDHAFLEQNDGHRREITREHAEIMAMVMEHLEDLPRVFEVQAAQQAPRRRAS